MNADRRKRIAQIITVLEDLGVAVEALREEEQTAFDNSLMQIGTDQSAIELGYVSHDIDLIANTLRSASR